MNLQEEQYVHFVSSTDNLNNAWQILQNIKQILQENKQGKGNPLVGAAFRFALIEYSKPYKCSAVYSLVVFSLKSSGFLFADRSAPNESVEKPTFSKKLICNIFIYKHFEENPGRFPIKAYNYGKNIR